MSSLAVLRALSRSSRKEPEVEKFPGPHCLVVLLFAAGLYYYTIFIVPGADANDPSVLTRGAVVLGNLAARFPAILAAMLLGIFVPPLVDHSIAKKYFVRAAMALVLVWGSLFVVTMHPAAMAAERVQQMLAMPRNFPELIRGPN